MPTEVENEFWCDVCHEGFYVLGGVVDSAICPGCGEDVLDVSDQEAPDLDGVDLPELASESFD